MDPYIIGILVVVTLLLAYTLYLVMNKHDDVVQMHLAPNNVVPAHLAPAGYRPINPVTKKASMQVSMQAPSAPANLPKPVPAPPVPANLPKPVPAPMNVATSSSPQAADQIWMSDSTKMQPVPHKYMGECESSSECPIFQYCNAVNNCTLDESHHMNFAL